MLPWIDKFKLMRVCKQCYDLRPRAMTSFDHNGNHPLHHAAEIGDVDQLKQLLETGLNPDVETKNDHRFSPLFLACCEGEDACAALLLDRKATVDQTNSRGWSAMMGAAVYNHLGCVSILINSKANLYLRTTSGQAESALDLASELGHVTIVEVIARAQQARTTQPVPLVIEESGYDSNGFDKRGFNEARNHRLHVAVQDGNLKSLKEQLDKSVDVDVLGAEACTALYLSCERGGYAMAKALLDRNADVNKTNETAWSPLMAASYWGSVDCVKLLLTRKADLSLHDRQERTALIMAKGEKRLDIASLLQTEQEDRARRVDAGVSALQPAPIPDPDVPLSPAVALGFDQDGVHLIHKAARDGDLKKLKDQLDNAIPVDLAMRNLARSTALHWACRHGKVACAQELLIRKANPNEQDSNGSTPLMATATDTKADPGHAACLSLLLSHQADVFVKATGGSANDKTALDLAIIKKRMDLIALLEAAQVVASMPQAKVQRKCFSLKHLLSQDPLSWVPEKDVKNCTGCLQPFAALFRARSKHHCRCVAKCSAAVHGRS